MALDTNRTKRMTRMNKLIPVCALFLCSLIVEQTEVLGQKQIGEHWVGTWATALAPRAATPSTTAAAVPTNQPGAKPSTVTRLANGFTDSNPQDANSPVMFENQTY